MADNVGLKSKLTLELWAIPEGEMTLDELEQHLKEIGNPILEIDRENNRIKMVQTTDTVMKIIN